MGSETRVIGIAVLIAMTASSAWAEVQTPGPTPGPMFVDVTASAGLEYVQHTHQVPPHCIFSGVICQGDPPVCVDLGDTCEPDRMSGGAAVGDVDGDGWDDLFVTRLDDHDLLFRNRGDGTFEDVTEAVGLDVFVLQSNGALFSDLDKDGDLDLYVSVLGEVDTPQNLRNYLFVQQDDGTFVDQAVERGAAIAIGSRQRTFSVSVGDFDRDGWPDLHVSEWVPDTPSHARLLRNRGAEAPGYFEDVTEAAGVNLDVVDAFASAFSDLDRDGWPDLVIAGDFGSSKLFWNNGDGTFEDGTVAAGVGTDENGMGSTIGDIDGDGDLDWFVTSIWDPNFTCEFQSCNWGYSGNRLYRNEGNRSFSDATDLAGVREGDWGWGAAFIDFDNDADLDVVMTNGVDFPGGDADQIFNNDPMRLWRNEPGGMVEIAVPAGIDDRGSGKGLLVFDYDRDGDQDVFVVNNGSTPRLFRNDVGQEKSWLRVRLLGSLATTDGLGALVTLQENARGRKQVREVGSVTHFLGQSERVAHFGLGVAAPGAAPLYRLKIRWPNGTEQTLTNVARNQEIVVLEPSLGD